MQKNNRRKYVDETSARAYLQHMKRQLELYEEMVCLCARQKSVLDADNLSAFGEITMRKHELSEEIEQLHRRTVLTRDRWKDAGTGLPEDVRRDVEKTASRMLQVVDGLVESEKQCSEENARRLGEMSEKIRRMVTGRKIVKDYGKASKPEVAHFIDKKR